MINLTSEKDIIQSLLANSLGESYIRFIVNTKNEGNMILEFYTYKYKFTLSKSESCVNALRVYDGGSVYLIPSFNSDEDAMKKNLLDAINYFSSKLEDFYTEKINKDREGTVYTWLKKE